MKLAFKMLFWYFSKYVVTNYLIEFVFRGYHRFQFGSKLSQMTFKESLNTIIRKHIFYFSTNKFIRLIKNSEILHFHSKMKIYYFTKLNKKVFYLSKIFRKSIILFKYLFYFIPLLRWVQ